MGTAGSFPWIKGLRHEHNLSISTIMNEWSSTSTPIICPAGMHKVSFNLIVCRKSHCPLHAEKIQILKTKYLSSVLYYARKHSCGKLFFIYVSPVCI
jgi:hypothetical protein